MDSEHLLNDLAKKTFGYSGAYLLNIIHEAAIFSVRNGNEIIKEVDINDAFDKITRGISNKKILSIEQKRIISYHEAGHAIIGLYCDKVDFLKKITIFSSRNFIWYFIFCSINRPSRFWNAF